MGSMPLSSVVLFKAGSSIVFLPSLCFSASRTSSSSLLRIRAVNRFRDRWCSVPNALTQNSVSPTGRVHDQSQCRCLYTSYGEHLPVLPILHRIKTVAFMPSNQSPMARDSPASQRLGSLKRHVVWRTLTNGFFRQRGDP